MTLILLKKSTHLQMKQNKKQADVYSDASVNQHTHCLQVYKHSSLIKMQQLCRLILDVQVWKIYFVNKTAVVVFNKNW